ncbi:hypothetical protein SAMN04515620_13235 [Collimonas sp. OK607]|uniref:hypothetical protein n=1 Tax=Collimonas sp. OK607 TaxID=1798194 RepID=UPI0008EF4B1C|nr:hypothetical protein [Collimonas sp. OK607]SFB26270.1 hypothetical protein SAMN04515620_13235 [Collimonas sp. OK607]
MRKIALLFIILGTLAVTGCTTLSDARSAKGTGAARVYDVKQGAVWAVLPRAVKEVGLDYVGDNRNDGYALAQRGISAFSYGENVAMFIEPAGAGDKTKVEVVSKRALATTVFATNWENVILDRLSEIFSAGNSGTPQASQKGVSTSASSGSTQQSDFVPAPSSFADIHDPDAIPFVGARARARYMVYLSALPPKAFAVSSNGGWSWLSNDPMAMRKALSECHSQAKAPCWLYAVDANVVWQSDENKRISLEQLDLPTAAHQ